MTEPTQEEAEVWWRIEVSGFRKARIMGLVFHGKARTREEVEGTRDYILEHSPHLTVVLMSPTGQRSEYPGQPASWISGSGAAFEILECRVEGKPIESLKLFDR